MENGEHCFGFLMVYLNNLVCGDCNKTFSTLQSLRRHYRALHQGVREVCPYCYLTFYDRSNLRVHIDSQHFVIDKTYRYIGTQTYASERVGRGLVCTSCPDSVFEYADYASFSRHISEHINKQSSD